MQETVAVFHDHTIISRNSFAEVAFFSSLGQHALLSRLFFRAGACVTPFDAKENSEKPSVYTIQTGIKSHITLFPNELAYTNHSCRPNIYFDTDNFRVVALRDIQPGDELCFFYPSTELDMASPFVCRCKAPECLGVIKGAKHLSLEILKQYQLTPFVHNAVFRTNTEL